MVVAMKKSEEKYFYHNELVDYAEALIETGKGEANCDMIFKGIDVL